MGLLSRAQGAKGSITINMLKRSASAEGKREYAAARDQAMLDGIAEAFERQHREFMEPKTHFTGLNVRFAEVLQDMCFPGDHIERGKSEHIMCKGKSDERK